MDGVLSSRRSSSPSGLGFGRVSYVPPPSPRPFLTSLRSERKGNGGNDRRKEEETDMTRPVPSLTARSSPVPFPSLSVRLVVGSSSLGPSHSPHCHFPRSSRLTLVSSVSSVRLSCRSPHLTFRTRRETTSETREVPRRGRNGRCRGT